MASIQSMAMHTMTQHKNGVTAYVIGLVFTLPLVSISLQFKPTTNTINIGVREYNSRTPGLFAINMEVFLNQATHIDNFITL